MELSLAMTSGKCNFMPMDNKYSMADLHLKYEDLIGHSIIVITFSHAANLGLLWSLARSYEGFEPLTYSFDREGTNSDDSLPSRL